MSRMRLTQQEADPIGGVTAAPIVTIGGVLAFGASLVLTIAHWHEVGSPIAAVLGIVLVAAAGVTAAISASPQFAPFTADRLWLIVALAVGGAIAEYVSTIGADRYLYDDYGPLVIGLLILAVAPYCTWISLLLAGIISAAVLSFLVLGSAAAAMTSVRRWMLNPGMARGWCRWLVSAGVGSAAVISSARFSAERRLYDSSSGRRSSSVTRRPSCASSAGSARVWVRSLFRSPRPVSACHSASRSGEVAMRYARSTGSAATSGVAESQDS